MLKRLVLLLLAAVAPLAARADSLSQSEVDAIVTEFQSVHSDAFDRGDAKAMARHLTDDIILQDEWGGITRGRANVEAMLVRVFAHVPKGTRFEDKSLASVEVSPGVIVSQGIASRLMPGVAEPDRTFFTRVLVLVGDQWQLAATQIARPSTVPKPGPLPK